MSVVLCAVLPRNSMERGSILPEVEGIMGILTITAVVVLLREKESIPLVVAVATIISGLPMVVDPPLAGTNGTSI